MIIAEFSNGVRLLFSFLAVLATIGLSILTFIAYRKQRQKYLDETNVLLEEFVSRSEIVRSIEYYIGRIGAFGNFTLFYFEIDDFDNLQQTLGREEMEKLLLELGSRLVKDLPSRMTMCHYSADGFLLFSKTEFDPDSVRETAQDILDQVVRPYTVFGGEEISITISMGVVMYPTCGSNFKELMSNLELANYVSRRSGQNKFTLYYQELRERESENLAYFKEVKDAIKNKEFTLYYQPIIDLKNNDIFGFEALLRWNHPVHGVLSPFNFISILEQSGDIHWVGLWGLEELIKESLILQEKFKDKDIKLSLNLSTKQLMSDTVSDDFRKLVRKYRIDPKKIILEIGEFAMYEQVDIIRTNLLRFRDIGFLVAVDGLGLDYTTLSSIEKQPIDMLKLARDFLEDMNNNFIKEKYVGMLVDYSNTTNRLVVSEGVENSEMVEYIQKNGINLAQGYYYSAPFADSEVIHYIEEEMWTKAGEKETATDADTLKEEETSFFTDLDHDQDTDTSDLDDDTNLSNTDSLKDEENIKEAANE